MDKTATSDHKMKNVGRRRLCEERDEMIKQLVEGTEAAKQLRKRMIITLIKSPKQVLDNLHVDDKEEEEEEVLINQSLVDKMLSSFDKTISIAKLINVNQEDDDHHQHPPSHDLISSPTTQNSHHQLYLSKKRKLMPKWSKEVNVGEREMVSGLEGALDDGFSWRKYGQKEILNAKFPRGYYRCTHRHTQSCQATKQVQRSHQDPPTYQVIYRGQHTCHPVAQRSKAHSKPITAQLEPLQIPQEQEVYLGLGPNDTLSFEDTQNESPAHIFKSFSFKTAHLDSDPLDSFLLGCSPTFGSPESSESNFFSLTPSRVTGPGAGMTVQTSESEWNGSLSGPSSVSNSPMGCDFEFPIDQLLDIDEAFPNFEF